MKNVVVIMSDQHSSHAVGCYGNNEVYTPNIDALAQTGVRFEYGYTTSPVCVPARFSALSGLYPSRTGCVNNATPLPIETQTAAHYFREAGYLTAFVGKMHPVDAQTHGFDYYIDFGHYYDYLGRKLEVFTKGMQADDSGKGVPWIDVYQTPEHHWSMAPLRDAQSTNLPEDEHFESFVVREALRFFRTYAPQRPVFLFVSFLRPHTPLVVPDRFSTLYDWRNLNLPNTIAEDSAALNPYLRSRVVGGLQSAAGRNLAKQHLARYYAAVSFVDDKVGQLLQGIKESSPNEAPIVCYTSDHGDMLFEHGMLSKFTFYEASVTVPWMMAGPGIPQGTTVAIPVDHTFLLPSLLDFAGLIPRTLDGVSVRGILAGDGVQEPVFSEYFVAQDKIMHMVRHQEWKFIRHPDGWCQLFNLMDDPFESNNLAGNDHPVEIHLNEVLTRHIEDLRVTTINLQGANPRV